MYKLLFLVYFIFGSKILYASIFFVSASGSDSNTGTIALPWKTVTYASSNSNPGDTIYIQAGLYNEAIDISVSGTSAQPIVFIGYKTTPGDHPPVLVNGINPYASFSTVDMPTFDGGNRAVGVALNCRGVQYIKIMNLQLRNFRYGLIAGGASPTMGNNHFFNINVQSIGDFEASYSGYGILLGSMGTRFSDSNVIDSCLVINAAAEGIGINGNYNTINGCKVFCNEDTMAAATDYFVIVTGSYNLITGCYIERDPNLSHIGHGYSAKTNAEQVIDEGLNLPAIAAEYNVFKNCVARNMGESFCVRHRTARYNLFYHCKAYGTHTGNIDSPSGVGNCIIIRDGASENIFDGCEAVNCNAVIRFSDTVEDGDTDPNPPGHPGNNNKIINIQAYNCYSGVYFFAYSIPSDAGDNLIANCTFYKTRYMFIAERSCANMKYKNNIFHGTLPAAPGGAFKTGPFAGDIVANGVNTNFSHCNFFNIQGEMPTNFVTSAINSISTDPLFTDTSNYDLHLLPGSSCINTGTTINGVLTDFDSIPRPQGAEFDIGAYEFQQTSIVNDTETENLLTLFPNPFTDVLIIHLNNEYDPAEFILYDLHSRKCIDEKFTNKISINTIHLVAGIYIYQVRVKNIAVKQGAIVKQ
jgi:hypothetical protein